VKLDKESTPVSSWLLILPVFNNTRVFSYHSLTVYNVDNSNVYYSIYVCNTVNVYDNESIDNNPITNPIINNLIIKVMATKVKTAIELQAEKDAINLALTSLNDVNTDTTKDENIDLSLIGKPIVRASLFTPIEGRQDYNGFIDHVELMTKKDKDTKEVLSQSYAFYSVKNALKIAFILPMNVVHSMVASSFLLNEETNINAIKTSLNFINNSRFLIQYVPVGEVLTNGTVVDAEHEKYYCSYARLVFSANMRNSAINAVNQVALQVNAISETVFNTDNSESM
jgi:hypothetical protein